MQSMCMQQKQAKKKKDKYVLFMILLFMWERLYYPSGATANIYNIYVLVIACTVFAVVGWQRSPKVGLRIRARELWVPLCLLFIGFHRWESSVEVFRNVLTFILIWICGKITLGGMKTLHRILIVLGAVYSIFQMIAMPGIRSVGFLIVSPTTFSYVLLIAVYALLFYDDFSFVDAILVSLAVGNVFLTQSRSTLLMVIILCVMRFVFGRMKKIRLSFSTMKNVSLILTFIMAVFAFEMFDLDNLSIRENQMASTFSRTEYIMRVVRVIQNEWGMLFLGKGGGFSITLNSSISMLGRQIPLHQDILMFVCDYGIIGTLFIYYVFIAKLQWSIIALGVFLVGTFHNFFNAPTVVLLFVLTENAMHTQKFYLS